jgi:hypothetical protein
MLAILRVTARTVVVYTAGLGDRALRRALPLSSELLSSGSSMGQDDGKPSAENNVTLHDVASAGLSKLLGKKRKHGSDKLAAWALQAGGDAGPRCGVPAIVRDDDTGEIPATAMEQSTADELLASDAVADDHAGNWLAEDTSLAQDLGDEEFDWEDGEDAGDDLEQVLNSNVQVSACCSETSDT